jgi:hypothetical protein
VNEFAVLVELGIALVEHCYFFPAELVSSCACT